MSKRYVVANNICRANTSGGITLDPSTRDGEEQPTGVIHDSFATVAGNVCADNTGAGIHTIHAGYVAVHGNVCDGTLSSCKDSESAGIAIVSSRHTVVGDNVLIANKYGVAFWGDPSRPTHRRWGITSLAATCTTGTTRRFTSANTIRRSGSCTSDRPAMNGVASTFRSRRQPATPPTASMVRST
jgi:hypothetical protein